MVKPVVTFIGAGSTVFTRNIAGDILSRPALAQAEIRLMDIDPLRLEESEIIVGKLAATLGGKATGEDLHRPPPGSRRRAISWSSASRSAATSPAR